MLVPALRSGNLPNMPLSRAEPNASAFNRQAQFPYNLRLKDFELAMQDVYDFFYDVNLLMRNKSLQRLDDMLRPAIMSGPSVTSAWACWSLSETKVIARSASMTASANMHIRSYSAASKSYIGPRSPHFG